MGWDGEEREWRSSCEFIQSTGFLVGGRRSKTVKFQVDANGVHLLATHEIDGSDVGRTEQVTWTQYKVHSR